jgi:hypothetical protein
MTTLLILLAISAAFLAFGLWMSINAKSGGQSTAGNLLILLGTVAALILLALAIPAHAHDHTRPDLNPWLKTLRNKNTVPCCDGSDATRLSDVDWSTKEGHYIVRLDGKWVDVPPEAVIEEPNRAGQTLVWPYFKDGMMVPRCFLPGSMI